MRKIIVALGVLAFGAMAMAQYEPDNASLKQSAEGFGFRIGAFLPTDSALRDLTTTWTDVGVEYDFQKSILHTGTTFGSFDWTSTKFLGGNHLASLCINQRFYTSNNRYAPGGTPYFYAGIGAEWTDIFGGTSSSWVARGGVGAEFKGNYLLEAGALISPKIHGVNPSGISISIGYRFK